MSALPPPTAPHDQRAPQQPTALPPVAMPSRELYSHMDEPRRTFRPGELTRLIWVGATSALLAASAVYITIDLATSGPDRGLAVRSDSASAPARPKASTKPAPKPAGTPDATAPKATKPSTTPPAVPKVASPPPASTGAGTAGSPPSTTSPDVKPPIDPATRAAQPPIAITLPAITWQSTANAQYIPAGFGRQADRYVDLSNRGLTRGKDFGIGVDRALRSGELQTVTDRSFRASRGYNTTGGIFYEIPAKRGFRFRFYLDDYKARLDPANQSATSGTSGTTVPNSAYYRWIYADVASNGRGGYRFRYSDKP